MDRRLSLLLAVAVPVGLAFASLFTVSESQLALRQRFGAIVAANYAPGLHGRVPFIDTVVRFDRRIVTQNYTSETFLTSENKGLLVDFYVKWRVADVSTYFRATHGSEESAGLVLAARIKDGIKAAVAQRTLQQIVADEQSAYTSDMFEHTSEIAAKELGIKLVDVRMQRIDLVDEVAGAVYLRMQEAFNARAKQLRAEGTAAADKVRAEADRQNSEIVANAARDAQRVRGEGDAAAAMLYARAYGRNPEFAAFYQSMQAYLDSIGLDGDVLVISPDGDFFKYLRSPAHH